MRLAHPLAPLLIGLTACASTADDTGGGLRPPPDGGAFTRPDGGVDPGSGRSRLLFFIAGTTAYAANAAGEGARPLCPADAIDVDALGERVLCIPAEDDQPLIFYDVVGGRVLAEIPGWVKSGNGRPALSSDGQRVATKGQDEQLRSVVRVYDDGGQVVDEVDAFEVRGFASDNVLLVEGPTPALWRIGQAPKALAGLAPLAVGPSPAGAVYDVAGADFHVDFEDFAGARTIAPGQIAAVAGTEVLARTIRNEATLVDVADPDNARALALPAVPFDRTLGLRLPRPGQVIVELRGLTNCDAVQETRATTSILLDPRAATQVELADTAPSPHRAEVGGERALIVDLDRCGAPTGTATVVDLTSAERRPLGELAPGALTAATLSVGGRFVAVGYADHVAVVDLDGGQLRAVVGEGPGRAFVFR